MKYGHKDGGCGVDDEGLDLPLPTTRGPLTGIGTLTGIAIYFIYRMCRGAALITS
jgi:hypothetical protein